MVNKLLSKEFAKNNKGEPRTESGSLERLSLAGPLVSIITVVRNGESTLERTIRSVIYQTYPRIEYIIIDGASSDDTLGIVRSYAQHVDYWLSEPDQGIYDAMNKGIALCNGETIGLLNCGDQYESDFVERLVNGLPQGRDIADLVLYSDYNIIYEDVGLSQKVVSTIRPWQGMSICHQAMLIGRRVYQKAGPYDSSLRLSADYEYLLRMVGSGTTFCHVPYAGVNFVDGGASLLMRRLSLQETAIASRRHSRAFSLQHLRFMVCYYYCNLVFYVYAKEIVAALFGKRVVNRVKAAKLKLLSKTTAIRLKSSL